MHERDAEKGYTEGDRMDDGRREHDIRLFQIMSDPSGDGRFSHPTQEEAGDGDAELDSGEIAIQFLEDFFGQECPFPSLLDLQLQLGVPYLYESEFAGDEKRIECNEDKGDEYANEYSEARVGGHIDVFYVIFLIINR